MCFAKQVCIRRATRTHSEYKSHQTVLSQSTYWAIEKDRRGTKTPGGSTTTQQGRDVHGDGPALSRSAVVVFVSEVPCECLFTLEYYLVKSGLEVRHTKPFILCRVGNEQTMVKELKGWSTRRQNKTKNVLF